MSNYIPRRILQPRSITEVTYYKNTENIFLLKQIEIFKLN